MKGENDEGWKIGFKLNQETVYSKAKSKGEKKISKKVQKKGRLFNWKFFTANRTEKIKKKKKVINYNRRSLKTQK